MPALLNRLRGQFSKPVLIWAALAVLLAVGVLHSLADLAGVPAQETMRANSEQQRVIIDPVSGAVSGLADTQAPAEPFDVADDTPSTPPDETAPPAEPTPTAEEPPSEEPAAQEPTVTEPVMESDAGVNYVPLATDRGGNKIPLVPRSKESLVTSPAPEVSEKIDNEMLPKRGAKDASPAKLYAKSYARNPDLHQVAIIVTGLGFNGNVLNQVLAMPNEVTAGVSPYADRPFDQIEALHNKGHEVWGLLPAMGVRYPQDDPGPWGLISALTVKGALTRLHTIMANTIGSVGFILPSDEDISTHKDVWAAIHDEIEARGLYLLSTHPTRDIKALGGDEVQQSHIRRSDMILDTTMGEASLRSKLAGIREAAGAQTELVVLIGASPQALQILADWLKTNPLDGVAQLVPLSVLYAPPKIDAPKEEKKADGAEGDESGEAPKEEAPKEEGH